MLPQRTGPPTRLRFLAAAILVIGLGCAGAIYLRAGSGAMPAYELEETKPYLRTLELYGGTANVLATEFRHWLSSLWHGQRLAFTVAFLTLVTACICWLLSWAPAARGDDRYMLQSRPRHPTAGDGERD
jgi:hypothetical protein